jgi:hypothetical protein
MNKKGYQRSKKSKRSELFNNKIQTKRATQGKKERVDNGSKKKKKKPAFLRAAQSDNQWQMGSVTSLK